MQMSKTSAANTSVVNFKWTRDKLPLHLMVGEISITFMHFVQLKNIKLL